MDTRPGVREPLWAKDGPFQHDFDEKHCLDYACKAVQVNDSGDAPQHSKKGE